MGREGHPSAAGPRGPAIPAFSRRRSEVRATDGSALGGRDEPPGPTWSNPRTASARRDRARGRDRKAPLVPAGRWARSRSPLRQANGIYCDGCPGTGGGERSRPRPSDRSAVVLGAQAVPRWSGGSEVGGGSVAGMPSSVTCSVHSLPDQYRWSCRPVGSASQPGAMPVNGVRPTPDDPTVGEGEGPLGSPCPKGGAGDGGRRGAARRRLEERLRTTNSAPKITRMLQEKCP
jgi:hypothetical protein